MPQRRLGYVITTVGGVVALLAFFAMPYFSLGFFGTATGSQVASAGGTFQGYSALWIEPVIAGIVLLVAATQLLNTQRSNDTQAGEAAAIGLITIAVLTLLIILGKYIFFDLQSSTSTNSLGYTTTSPAIASFYSSGFWVYIISMIAVLVGGVVANSQSKDNSQDSRQ